MVERQVAPPERAAAPDALRAVALDELFDVDLHDLMVEPHR